MSNEVAKKAVAEVDGFDGYEDGTEGGRERGGQVIQGQRIKFTNEATWEKDDGQEIDEDREFIAVDIARVVQKWRDQMPVETIILAPHQKFPDVGKMNEAVPREQWVEGPDGNPRGPWQAQHIVCLLDPKNMDRFSYPTGTIGGAIATRDLTDKVKWMRRFRGENVFAVVSLRDVFMPTRFGGRQRPHLEVKRWVRFGDGGEPLAVTGPIPVADSSAGLRSRSTISPRRRRRRPSRRAACERLIHRRRKKSPAMKSRGDGMDRSSMPLEEERAASGSDPHKDETQWRPIPIGKCRPTYPTCVARASSLSTPRRRTMACALIAARHGRGTADMSAGLASPTVQMVTSARIISRSVTPRPTTSIPHKSSVGCGT
jgi:hypothetical protein